MEEPMITSYEEFIKDNRKRINRYLNIILRICIFVGPAIALGIFCGVFKEVTYSTCIGISVILLSLAVIHSLLLKRYPDAVEVGLFALVVMDILLVYMTISHVAINLTWFWVPLVSLLYCDRMIFIFTVTMNYLLMGVSSYLTANYFAALRSDYETPFQYFLNAIGGLTIETLIMIIAGYMLGKLSGRYFRELIAKNEAIRGHEKGTKEKMDILDSMAEIYDNVNLINFINSTEMSLREETLVEHGIDMSRQSHTLMNQRLKNTVMPDMKEDFLAFTNITTVRARLTHKKIISADFIDIIKGWFRAQYITVDATADGIPNMVIYTTRNIDDEKRREEHLMRISMTDELTRLFNRRCYEEDIAEYREKPIDDDFVLFSIDVNGLKIANDTLGHAAGDELIKGAADCLASSVGSQGKVYRTGGDEFLAIVHTDKPEEICESIRHKTEEWHGMYMDKISVSVGFATHKDKENETID
ncbi:MAG: GGDEF domain-containing protein [Lachnospiraceae bacterium]|nr:GGDEF domain-containing protein [Lachnospiraceae bacterium]